MRRRGFILGMVTLLAFQCLGYYVAFVMQVGLHKAWMRQEVEAAETESLTFLQLTDAEYQSLAWSGKYEFWHNGVIHDLKIATQVADGSWRIMCMADEKETLMLNKGAQTIEEEDTESDANVHLEKAPTYTQPAMASDFAPAPAQADWPTMKVEVRSLTMEILSPPPRRA